MNNIAIIGSGPSALFTAKTVLENSKNIKVYIYERGKAPWNRTCHIKTSFCKKCNYCNVINGGGGSGLFSDGKLVLDLTSGGKSLGIDSLSLNDKESITNAIMETFERFDGVSEFKNIPTYKDQVLYNNVFEKHNLKMKYYSVMHMGTYNLVRIIKNFIEYLTNTYGDRIVFHFETEVVDIIKNDAGDYSLITNRGENSFSAVVVAVGKAGADWLKLVLQKFGCKFIKHNYFFGFRLETPSSNIENLINISLDPKIYRLVNERKVKIHCVCRNGDIRPYNYNGILFVGGHSPYTKNNLQYSKMDRANFNVMVSFDTAKIPVNELFRKLKDVAGQKILVQRWGDFATNKETHVWGKLAPKNENMFCKKNIREIMDLIDLDSAKIIVDFIDSLSKISNGIADYDNIIYAPAIEWDMDTVEVNENMETSQNNIFAVGDGAGLSQGIVYSAATGIIAGRKIISKLENVPI